MNILFLAHRIPYPPNKGDKLRAFNEIKYLAKKHTVDLCALYDDPEDKKNIDPLKELCRNVKAVPINAKLKKMMSLSTLLSPKKTCTGFYFYEKRLQLKIDSLVCANKYDVIFVFCSSMIPYIRPTWDIPIAIDFVDVDSDKWAQYSEFASFPKNIIFRAEGKKMASFEKDILRQVDISFVVTQDEADFFIKKHGSSKVYSIPNGIDMDFFNSDAVEGHPLLKNEKYIVFTGAMDYFPNEDGVIYFNEKIFPLIKEKEKDLKFYIVGRNPTEKVKRLSDNPDIVVTGQVDDVRPYLKHAKLAVIPLRMARGIQNKILEAMAMGIAVVTSPNAYEGLSMKVNKDLYVTDNPSDFAGYTLRLLNNPDEAKNMANSALKSLADNYTWENNMSKMEKMILQII